MRAYGKDVWSRRRGAGVNAPGGNSLSGRNGGKRAVLRGEHVISRKATAQGRPDALRWTCMLVCALFVHIARETAGAARTRSSLRPLTTEGEEFPANLGRNARRECEHTSACRHPPPGVALYHPSHCERSEAIHSYFSA